MPAPNTPLLRTLPLLRPAYLCYKLYAVATELWLSRLGYYGIMGKCDATGAGLTLSASNQTQAVASQEYGLLLQLSGNGRDYSVSYLKPFEMVLPVMHDTKEI